jgi:hypothetical protein
MDTSQTIEVRKIKYRHLIKLERKEKGLYVFNIPPSTKQTPYLQSNKGDQVPRQNTPPNPMHKKGFFGAQIPLGTHWSKDVVCPSLDGIEEGFVGVSD